MSTTTYGFALILAAKRQAEAHFRDPRLALVMRAASAIARDIEHPGLPPHIVERGLHNLDRVFDELQAFRRSAW